MSSTIKRKRSSSPQGGIAPRASTSRKRTDWWARKAEFDEPDLDEEPDSEVERMMMEMSPNKPLQLSSAQREVPETPSQSKSPGSNRWDTEPRSTIKEDPDNPFLVSSTPKRAGVATPGLDNVHKTPGGSIIPKSKASEALDEFLESQIKLKAAIETADRKAYAASRTIEWKVKRINELEAELEDLRKQNEELKRENDELRQSRY